MNILIHPTYFPSISHFAAMAQADTITFEMEDSISIQSGDFAIIKLESLNDRIAVEEFIKNLRS